jgi:ribosome-associated toxin RatA of RatAB toxin-antitoxin module
VAGAEQEIRVAVTPEAFFAVISDYERYPEFLPDMESAEVLSRREGHVEARFTANFIKRISYTLRLEERAPTFMEWSLIEGPFKVSDGGWRLERLADGGTLARYRIEVQVNAFVPKSVSTRIVATTVPALLKAFKERAEAIHPRGA